MPEPEFLEAFQATRSPEVSNTKERFDTRHRSRPPRRFVKVWIDDERGDPARGCLIAEHAGPLWMAEDAARELPNLPLEDALQLVHLYFERGSPKAEPAARRWLVRYLSEGTPSLRDVATVTASLAERDAA